MSGPFSRYQVLPGAVRRRVRSAVPLVALLLALTGCVSEQEEIEIGNALAANVNPQLPLVRNPLLNRYIDRIGRRVAQAGSREAIEYRFYIINSPVVNAFALPGGHIYVTRGLIQEAETGAELAGVLAHEIGHVEARHGIEKLQRELRTGSLISMLYNLFLGGEPALLRQNALELGGVLWSARHSREDEHEADELAIQYLIRSGIDPHAVVSLHQKLIAQGGRPAGRAAEWFSTHPLTAERIERAQEEIAEATPLPPSIEDAVFPSYPAFRRRVAALPLPPRPER